MAKKKPQKDKFLLKERWEIEDLVFDKETLLALAKIMEKGIFEKLDYLISMGKEANVYRAKVQDGYVAVKIYKKETARFFKRHSYIVGDPRFPSLPKSERELVNAFASKEFKNLKIAYKAGVAAPIPLYHLSNVVVMSFLGENGLPYPKIADDIIHISKEDFYDVINSIKKLYANKLVHGDLSEYNILKGEKTYIIDFSQGVVLKHPRSEELLHRDIRNIVKYFKKKTGLNVDINKVIKYVKGKAKGFY